PEEGGGPDHPTTMFTSRGGRLITFFTSPSPIHSLMRGDSSARRSASSALIEASTSARSRTLPLTWITMVTTSSLASSGTYSGHDSVASMVVWPVRRRSSGLTGLLCVSSMVNAVLIAWSEVAAWLSGPWQDEEDL